MANSGMITLRFEDMEGRESFLELSKSYNMNMFNMKLEEMIKKKNAELGIETPNKIKVSLFIERDVMRNYANNQFRSSEFVDLLTINFGRLIDFLTYYDITEETIIKYLITERYTPPSHVRAVAPPFKSIIGFDIWFTAVRKTKPEATHSNMKWKIAIIPCNDVIASIDDAFKQNTITQDLADNVKGELVFDRSIKCDDFAAIFNRHKMKEDAEIKKIKNDERKSVSDEILAKRANRQAEINSRTGGRSYRKRNTKYRLRHSVKNKRTRRTRR